MNQPASSEPSENPWLDYINGEVERLLAEAGPKLTLAMIHSRAIEAPELYYKNHSLYKADLSKAHFGITKAGYWERIALRALVLMDMPLEQREQLIAEALKRNQEAKAASDAKIKRGPGGPYRQVDLSKLTL